MGIIKGLFALVLLVLTLVCAFGAFAGINVVLRVKERKSWTSEDWTCLRVFVVGTVLFAVAFIVLMFPPN